MYNINLSADNINLLFISDLHLCNNLDRIDLVYKAYEYANKRKIKYIVNLGDLIDSVMPHNRCDIKIDKVESQVKYVIDNYPYSSNIKTLMLYGNHDYYSKYLGNIDIASVLEKERKDIYNLGYGESYLRISDNFIKLSHDLVYTKDYKKSIGTNLSFMGHFHLFKTRVNDDNIYINVPSLSNINPGYDYNLPCMLDVDISFQNDMMSKIEIECIDLEHDVVNSMFSSTISTNPKKFIKIKEQVKEYNLI